VPSHQHLATYTLLGFDKTGDFLLGNGLKKLGSLLDRGVKVALVYGDRDYQCNWYGGEAISLAIDSHLSTNFKNAGYANIETNASYVGGFVRQYGNLSFARVFDAAHEGKSISIPPPKKNFLLGSILTDPAPYYQPETTYQIFNRVMFNTDVATGKIPTTSDYSSTGRSSAWSPSKLPTANEMAQCYLWDVMETCTKAEKAVLMSGQAVVKDFVLVGEGKVVA
jgi:hypothetical protein